MDNELLRIRQDVYDAGASYRRAVSERLQIMHRPGKGDPVGVMRQLDSTAEEYRRALHKLTAYLQSLESSPENEKELGRVKTISEEFERDLRLIR
jgi:hypothetical protein